MTAFFIKRKSKNQYSLLMKSNSLEFLAFLDLKQITVRLEVGYLVERGSYLEWRRPPGPAASFSRSPRATVLKLVQHRQWLSDRQAKSDLSGCLGARG